MKVILTSLIALMLLGSGFAYAGTYLNSAHGDSSNGVDRYAATGAKHPDTDNEYATGHCGHCHEMHASIGGGEPAPTGDTQNPYALFKENYGSPNKNTLCYACHNNLTVGTTGSGRYGVYQGSSKYDASIHNTDTTDMQWPDGSPPGPNYIDGGNCNNCHNPHGYNDGSLIPSMIFKREEGLCNACHDGNPEAKDIEADVTDTNAHKVGDYSGVHDPSTEYLNENTTKHVECVDCHNPHTARDTTHTAGTTGNAIATTSPLYGALGSTPTFKTTNWTAPTVYAVQTATKEYEICFKCHSGANSNWTNWDGSGAAAWTDVGLDFSPDNKSYHPVAQPLNWIGGGSSVLKSYQLISPWSPGDTMYCTDCHESDSGVAGPHGSATKWMLAGTNKAWPYRSASDNGTSSGTFRDLDSRSTSLGTVNGLFCRNCHTVSINNDHIHGEDGDHEDIPCVGCHIRVPHGGKVSRLQSLTNVPNRLRPNGNGGGTVYDTTFRKASSYSNYDRNDCYSTNRSCGRHDNSFSGENW